MLDTTTKDFERAKNLVAEQWQHERCIRPSFCLLRDPSQPEDPYRLEGIELDLQDSKTVGRFMPLEKFIQPVRTFAENVQADLAILVSQMWTRQFEGNTLEEAIDRMEKDGVKDVSEYSDSQEAVCMYLEDTQNCELWINKIVRE